jgi:hypothetical protein
MRRHLSVAPNPDQPEASKTPWGTLVLTTFVVGSVGAVAAIFVNALWNRGTKVKEQMALQYLMARDQAQAAPPGPPAAPPSAAAPSSEPPGHPMTSDYAQAEPWRSHLDQFERRVRDQERKIDAQGRQIKGLERKLAEYEEEEDEDAA